MVATKRIRRRILNLKEHLRDWQRLSISKLMVVELLFMSILEEVRIYGLRELILLLINGLREKSIEMLKNKIKEELKVVLYVTALTMGKIG